MHAPRDTIAAIATPPGHGGVGIVRLSGPAGPRIAEAITGASLSPRHAHYVRFRDAQGTPVDDGIAIHFAAPHSYTGEDVVELQAHGSPAVLAQLLDAACALGARRARAGEFTERAFLEGRLDLAQAEAVADLIAASDIRAARAARRSLDGEFSRRVDGIAAALLHVRIHCEAAIDFADEPLDTLGGGELHARMDSVQSDLQALLHEARCGQRLRDGLHAVIVGAPNVGKSSLLNALAGVDRAIVTETAGTTRDTLVETVRVDGVELTLVDTAGLRDSGDAIEREGMRRAHVELQHADLAIVVLDVRDAHEQRAQMQQAVAEVPQVLWLANKCDLLADPSQSDADLERDAPLPISARTGAGLAQVRRRLQALAGAGDAQQGTFSARARHVDAIERALAGVADAREQLLHEHLDLAADDLARAHDALGTITGRVDADALLGHIFSSFCIGK